MKAQLVSLSDWSSQSLSNEQLATVKGGFGHPHNIFAANKALKYRNPWGGKAHGAEGSYRVGEDSGGEDEYQFEEEMD